MSRANRVFIDDVRNVDYLKRTVYPKKFKFKFKFKMFFIASITRERKVTTSMFKVRDRTKPNVSK